MPNFTIQKNPKSIDTSNPSSRSSSPRHSGADIFAQAGADLNQNSHSNIDKGASQSPSSNNLEAKSIDKDEVVENLINLTDNLDLDAEVNELCRELTSVKVTTDNSKCYSKANEFIDLSQLSDAGSSKASTLTRRPDILSLTTHASTHDPSLICDDDISIGSGSTGGPDSRSCSPMSDVLSLCDVISLTETAERIAESHNLLFPADSSAVSAASNGADRSPSHLPKPGVFSVDLGKNSATSLVYSHVGLSLFHISSVHV